MTPSHTGRLAWGMPQVEWAFPVREGEAMGQSRQELLCEGCCRLPHKLLHVVVPVSTSATAAACRPLLPGVLPALLSLTTLRPSRCSPTCRCLCRPEVYMHVACTARQSSHVHPLCHDEQRVVGQVLETVEEGKLLTSVPAWVDRT